MATTDHGHGGSKNDDNSASHDRDKEEDKSKTNVDVTIDEALSKSDDPLYAQALLSTSEDAQARDPRWITTRWELWAYYLYYVGNNGLPGFNYGPSQLQNLLSQAATNAGNGLCGDDGQPDCRLSWAGQERTVQSIVLLSNGIAFAIQVVLFLAIGAFADYGRWRPYILIAFTVLAVATGLSFLGVDDPSQWQAAIALYILGLIGYQGSLTFWTAAFPGLSRNLPEMRESAKRLAMDPPQTTPEEHADLDNLSRNRVSNVAFISQSAGELVILAVVQGMLIGIHADDSTERNTKSLSAVCAFTAGVWLLCALPFFFLEKHRPGQPLPPGTTYLTAGARQAMQAAKYLWRLKQTLLYLCFYFLFGDAFNTSVTVISTVQNQILDFSSTKFNEVLIVGIAAQLVGIQGAWLIQKRYHLSTLTLLRVNVFFIVLLQGWGFIGIFTNKFGFHNVWEVWVYQLYYGLFACPWYAVSQTMISQFSVEGKEFLFFSLFSIVGKSSSFVGPFVTSAIADRTGNQSSPFYFLLALSVASSFLLLPMDLRKARIEQAVFIEKENRDRGLEQSTVVFAPEEDQEGASAARQE